MLGEDRQIRMLLIKLLERVPDRFDTATHTPGNPPRYLGGAASRTSQAAGPFDDLFAL